MAEADEEEDTAQVVDLVAAAPASTLPRSGGGRGGAPPTARQDGRPNPP
jgi:hypothetical protein